MLRLGLALLAACASSTLSAAQGFGMPVSCEYGRQCVVQKYVDILPAQGATAYQDYRCGKLSNDGHDGTDFRIIDLPGYKSGVPVLAIADGVVRGTRDGEPDISVHSRGQAAIAGRECGNGMAILHADGYESQYCHLRKGSVRVGPGQHVKKGQMLGLVGMSGLSEYPHLHLTLRHDKQPVDPFTGRLMRDGGCQAQGAPLWASEVAERLKYIPSGLLHSWFHSAAPDPALAREGAYSGVTRLPASVPALVFGVELFGGLKGDLLQLEVRQPDGQSLVTHQQVLDRPLAQFSQFAGKRLTLPAWPRGEYVGTVKLQREGKALVEERRVVLID